MTATVVVPFVWEPYLYAFMKTSLISPADLYLIDNTYVNRGIMRSHNMGIDRARRRGTDWLVCVSAAIRFGPNGGLDFLAQLDDMPDHIIVSAASEGVKDGADNEVFGWHLIAFRTEIFDRVGRWDENFTPYGFDDIDLSIRVQKTYGVNADGALHDKITCDVHDTTMGHSINLANIEAPAGPRIAYFEHKWGRHPGAYLDGEYDLPFADPTRTVAWWPPAENGGRWDDTGRDV